MKLVTDPTTLELARRYTRADRFERKLNPAIVEQYVPLVRMLEDVLASKDRKGELLLPELRFDGNETVAAFSDYGGEASDARYQTYASLVCGWNHSYPFFEEMKALRATTGLGDKEIAFKDLRFGPLRRSLPEYLKLADHCVCGLLVTVIVDKGVETLHGGNGRKTRQYVCETLGEYDLGVWTADVAEKLGRVVHLVAYLIALLSREGHKVVWMTDHDAIAPNETQFQCALRMFQSVLDLYAGHRFDLIAGALPDKMKGRDLLSLADLTAGATEFLYTHIETKRQHRHKEAVSQILQWLGHDGLALKKLTVVVRRNADGHLVPAEVRFKPTSIPENVAFIPIPIPLRLMPRVKTCGRIGALARGPARALCCPIHQRPA